MTTERAQTPRDLAYELLEERIAYLELLKSFHEEVVKIIRIYTSNDAFTAERCLQEIVNFIQRRFDLYMVTVLLVDDLTRDLVLLVAAGEEASNPAVKSTRLKQGEGLAGHAVRTGETLRVDDVTQDARFVRGPIPATQSEVCVPIKVKHRIVGILDLEDREKGRFNREFAQLMEELAVNIGFVLENKKLYDDLKEHSSSLEIRVEEKVSELQKSEQRYRAIVENVTDPIVLTDLDGRLTWVNPAFSSALGFTRGEMEGTNISRFVKKGNLYKIYGVLRDVSEGRESRGVQIELTTKGGEDRIFELAPLGVRENGHVTGLQATLRDVTERTIVDKLKKNYFKTLEEAVVQRTAEIKDTQRAAILAIANLAESIDDDTGGHIQRIQDYAKILAVELKKNSKYKEQITDEYVELIYDLSPLHDLGKVGIRDYILQKPDKLTPEEFEKMKDHTDIGGRALRMAGEMIRRESIFSIGEMIARFHHEKWDGSGYPAVEIGGEHRPLRAEEIPLCARIVALADVYDALTSKRPYKMPFPHEKAREMILRESGKHFDPEVVEAFRRSEPEFVRVRSQFPDTHLPEGRPFELPARDRT
ncbi:MAG: PAS domain S-box protein [Planctomycetes bacterium]|nr:PAS domain S-box protein [Planctomycetota bacterium]